MTDRPRTIKASMLTLTCLRCGSRRVELHYDAFADKWVCESCLLFEDKIQREAAMDDLQYYAHQDTKLNAAMHRTLFGKKAS